MNLVTRAVTFLACAPLRTLLETIPIASAALDLWRDTNILPYTLRRVHKRDVCLNFNVFADQDLILVR